MALTLTPETSKTASLEEYLEYVKANVDIRDDDSIIESAPMLSALANNRNLLADKLNQELADWQNFQKQNFYTAQTFILGSGDGLFVRANLWVPPSEVPEVRDWEDPLFAYLIPHDHNFSFLTVGYWGPGYETTIYEYDPDRILGVPGEKVELSFLERTTLSPGKVMFYRASRDVHRQEHPPSFSISLNLMVSPPEVAFREQFCFDLDSHRIKDIVSIIASRLLLCRLAKYVGDSTTAAHLESLSGSHPNPRVRAEALRSLAVLEPSSSVEILEKALDDKSVYVRESALEALRNAFIENVDPQKAS